MTRLFGLLVACAICNIAWAQMGINGDYAEPTDGFTADVAAWNKLPDGLQASWASRDVLYRKCDVPAIKMKSDTVLYAWRGERIGMEALLFSKSSEGKIALRTYSSTLTGEARFVNYVLTDNFRGCGNHPTDRTPYLVPDVIDLETTKQLKACEVRPVWITIEVPQEITPGTHSITMDVVDEQNKILSALTLRVVVNERVLPQPEDYAFNLNFWQQPYAVSRYYGLTPWSLEHIEALRPYMQMLARAGQKSATAILFYEPWGVQSNDKFEPMVETTKKADGSWSYDYTVFDKWISLLESCGISKQINCFSMVPWDMNFRYWDEAKKSYGYLKTTTSEAAYRELWTSFLVDFAAHLKEKGWFDKTIIAMDERGLGDMLNAYRIAQAAVPGIKMSLAGNYHSELVDKMYDYCLAYHQEFTPAELTRRNEKGWISTCYTACPDAEPNLCSNNNPSDAAYLPLHAISKGFNGFLRWAWMNWTDDPLRDTRFRMFTPGDTYVVYPGGRSGIRFERFIEGVQAAEKVRLLREEYTKGNKAEELKKLNDALASFETGVVSEYLSSAWMVNYMESVLNGSPEPVMEEATEYCTVYLSSDKSDIALAKRWLKTATTSGCEVNLKYSASSPSATGYILAETPIQVKRGTTFRLNTKPTTNDDDLRWCRSALFADWNSDFIFSPTELVGRAGSKESGNTSLLSHTYRITVPEDATPGISRLRLCYADSWKPEPQPCGELFKGFAFDIPMEIIDETSSIASVSGQPTWQGKSLKLKTPSRVFVYNTLGALLDYSPATSVYSMEGFFSGTYILCVIDDSGRKQTIRRHIF